MKQSHHERSYKHYSNRKVYLSIQDWKALYMLFQINVYRNQPRGKWLFWGKSFYFNEQSLKKGKSQGDNSFLLIHCNFIIIENPKVQTENYLK